MATIVSYGYLELPYLEYPYLTETAQYGYNSQVQQVIADFPHTIRIQVQRDISDFLHKVQEQVNRQILDFTHTVNMQTDLAVAGAHAAKSEVARFINDFEHEVRSEVEAHINDHLHSILVQALLQINSSHTIRNQVQRDINDFLHPVQAEMSASINDHLHTTRDQVQRQIADSQHSFKSQVTRNINDELHKIKNQVSLTLSSEHTKRMEVRRGNVLFETCADAGYLMQPYLTTPYLGPYFCAGVRSQVARYIVNFTHAVRAQVQREIADHLHTIHDQVQRQIADFFHTIRVQVQRLQSKTVMMQVTQVLYNTTNLRILQDFPSRGTSGLNWVASTTAAGDFGVNNLNTDIVEQTWRGANTFVTSVTLTCDTQVSQGIFLDTLAILNHNLTSSANVVLQGSNDVGFATVGFTETLTIIKNHPNIYYIAPTLPTDSFRYWRFIINDLTNTFGYIQFGTIVFGSSIIFQGENIIDEVTKTTRHFADKIQTEGFTNVSNDRALKTMIDIEFRNLQFARGNYRNIRGVFDTARTSLKCLWIPDPRTPERFAVFGKLPVIPPEKHNNIGINEDYINFSVEVDESL